MLSRKMLWKRKNSYMQSKHTFLNGLIVLTVMLSQPCTWTITCTCNDYSVEICESWWFICESWWFICESWWFICESWWFISQFLFYVSRIWCASVLEGVVYVLKWVVVILFTFLNCIALLNCRPVLYVFLYMPYALPFLLLYWSPE